MNTRDVDFFSFSDHTRGIWKFLGGIKSNLCHSCSKARSLTHCAWLGIKPVPQQQPELILNPLCYSGNSKLVYLEDVY